MGCGPGGVADTASRTWLSTAALAPHEVRGPPPPLPGLRVRRRPRPPAHHTHTLPQGPARQVASREWAGGGHAHGDTSGGARLLLLQPCCGGGWAAIAPAPGTHPSKEGLSPWWPLQEVGAR